MGIETWWPLIKPESRQWLMDHNGEAIRGDIVAEIAEAGGIITSDAWWVGQSSPTGFYLSSDASEQVEEVANGEDKE